MQSSFQICITDEEDSDLLSHLPSAINFIQGFDTKQTVFDSNRFNLEVLRDGRKILVHCRHGVSRSASVILAWMMETQSRTLTEASGTLASLRPQCKPNNGFIKQLKL